MDRLHPSGDREQRTKNKKSKTRKKEKKKKGPIESPLFYSVHTTNKKGTPLYALQVLFSSSDGDIFFSFPTATGNTRLGRDGDVGN